MRPATNFWTPDKLEQLITLRNESLSCGQISRKLGKSRNTVIGKLTRMNLPSLFRGKGTIPRGSYYERPPKRQPLHKPNSTHSNGWKQATAAKLPTIDERLLRPVQGRGKPIYKLGDRECRFQTGFNKAGLHIFCGHETDGSSWCEKHAVRVLKKGAGE